MRAEATFKIADEFEIGEHEITVFLLNQAFGEGILDKWAYFTLLHAEYNSYRRNFPQ